MIIQQDMDLMKKLTILSDAAKYDAACTSSGVNKKNNGAGLGNAKACGICHSFSADGRCISLLKILFTNECIYNCRYCVNRSSNDVLRATFTPEEVCRLTIEFYRRNYIEGLFLSSGIIVSPDETMKRLTETVMLLRTKYHFGGYIHLKGIPGASQSLIETAGWYADRMSVNLELPTADGLKTLAPHKSRKNILTPMRQLQRGIHASQLALGIQEPSHGLLSENAPVKTNLSHGTGVLSASGYQPPQRSLQRQQPRFVPAGQSTQMIIGATKETDYHIVTVAEALYHNYDLKRVFYSAFVNVNHDEALPAQPDGKGVPLLREHRLYQADWLMRFYGFHSGELLSEEKPNFNVLLDPKCDWAIRHLEQFPVEINRADYYTLLRVPGIGVRSAQRIVKARRSARLDFKDIKKMGVVLKRALYFITCSGRTLYPIRMNEDFITNGIIGIEALNRYQIEHHDSYRQLSLFDDFHMDTPSSDKWNVINKQCKEDRLMYTARPEAPLCPVTVYLCEDTIDGIFTAIYRAWSDGTSHTDVRVRTNDTMSLFETYIFSESDETLARKVQRSIIQKLSIDIYETCYQAMLSDDDKKASTLYHFLQKAFRCGSDILNRLNDPDVFRIFELSRTVGHEAHKYLGFVRFEERNENLLTARIQPKSNVLPVLAAHFADRLQPENWIILDTIRRFAAIHPAGKPYFLQWGVTEEMLLSVPVSDHEKDWEQLWSCFFNTIAIQERRNTDLQRSLMPLHYRTYMPEITK